MNARANSALQHAAGALRAARLAFAALAVLAFAGTAVAQNQEDLPGRVGRISDVAGELFIAPQDKPDAWSPAGINYPVTSGDNLWMGGDGRAEVDFGGGQFRMAGDSSVHVSWLDDRRFSLFVAQGRVSLRVRALEPGDVATVDTPNAQIAITRPGLYRVEVTEDRQRSLVIVREGEANVLTQAAVQQVLPGQVAYVEGADPQFANVQNGAGLDGFDSWVASRDRMYRVRGNNYVSPQMVGAADLDQYGTWTQAPEYGTVWYPNDVPADWAPYRNGYWVDVGTWGPTWVDYAPWGYAPFHYGRWGFIGGRWGWMPGVYAPRPLWAPALVAWTGGSGWSLSVTTGSPVYGWVPLSWGEPFRPWWGRCSNGCWDRYNRPFNVNVAVVRPSSPPPQRFRNTSAPGGVTAVPFQAFQSRQSVQQNLVRVPRDVANAPILAAPPAVRNDVTRGPVQRPGAAPPPASTFQPAMARQTPAGPNAATPIQPRTGAAGQPGQPGQLDNNANRGRAGMPTTAAPAPGTPTQGVARPASPGNPFAPTQPTDRSGAVATPSQPQQQPGSATRDTRPGMGVPATSVPVPQGQPAMRGQPQQAAPQVAQPATQPSPQRGQPQALPQQPGQSLAQPVMRPQPVPQAAPQQPAMRPQQPQAMQPAPVMRPQPQVVQTPAPQAMPQQQPMQRGQPQAAPQPAPQAAPGPRAAPQQPVQPGQPQPDQGRQGGDPGNSGNVTRGERGR